MRFKKYFMCEDCDINLVQAGHKIHKYINNSDCPRCGKCLMSDVKNANKRYAHCVMSSLIFYSEEFPDLVRNVEKCVENCEHNTLINENKREYSVKQWKKLTSLIQEKKYEKLNLWFLDVPEQKKLNQMSPNGDATDSQSQVDTETDGLYSLYDETSGSSKDSKSPKPTKHIVENFLGICDVLFLGTAHNAPILGDLINEMESNCVDLVMVESGAGMSEIDRDASVGNKVAEMYGNMYEADSYILQGTPGDLRELANNPPSTSVFENDEDTWAETDLERFSLHSREMRQSHTEYYNSIISQRNGKFAMEAVGYILNNKRNMDGNACIIAGKTHIEGIYKRMSGDV